MVELAEEIVNVATNPEISDSDALKEVARAILARGDTETTVALCWTILAIVAKQRAAPPRPMAVGGIWRAVYRIRRHA